MKLEKNGWIQGAKRAASFLWFLMFLFLSVIVGCSEMTSEAGSDSNNFRFEDFQEEGAMRNALYKLHPKGSDFEPLLRTLREAGASCEEDDIYSDIPTGKTVQELKEQFGNLRIFSCKHVRQSAMNRTVWGVYVHIRGNGKLHELVSYIHRT